MKISGNEDIALSSQKICSVHLITYSQADITKFTREWFANVLVLILRMVLPPKFCNGFALLNHIRLMVSLSTLQLSCTKCAVGLQSKDN